MTLFTILVTIGLVVLSGLFSGLTLGLMSLSTFSLKRKVMLGDKQAQRIYPLRKKGNLLLCTLLLGNVAVNASLSIFLGSLTTGFAAGLLATALIVVFGEILPQSIFARYALLLGSKTSWLVSFFMIVFYPVAKPLALALDAILGEELPTIFSKKEFRAFLHQQQQTNQSELDKDDFAILHRGLIFSDKKVKDIMTPLNRITYIEHQTRLTAVSLNEIHKSGHSRIPVVHTKNKKVVGMLYAKDLISLDPNKEQPVETLMRKSIQYIREDAKLDDVLELFRKKHLHLFVVLNKHQKVVGIITLEDVLEELVGEIVDEYDRTQK